SARERSSGPGAEARRAARDHRGDIFAELHGDLLCCHLCHRIICIPPLDAPVLSHAACAYKLQAPMREEFRTADVMSFCGSAPLPTPLPRGFFGCGAERISKAMNLGNIMRSAHAFGASFTFTVGATYQALEARADTSKGQWHLPHYNWAGIAEIALPAGC